MKWRLAAFMLMIGVCHALGQSAPTNPPMTYGMTPTVGQWISWFQQKQDVLGSAPLTTAGGTMLGRLNLFPSSLARAGTNLGVGITPTAPVDGDIWITASGAFTQVNGSTVSFGIPLGSGVGTLLSGTATGTGGPVGSISPTLTGTPRIVGTLDLLPPTGLNNGFTLTQAMSGTTSSSAGFPANYIAITSDVAAITLGGTGAYLSPLAVQDLNFGGSAAQGGRIMGNFEFTQTAMSNSASPLQDYVGVFGFSKTLTGEGGSSGALNGRGAYWGGWFVTQLGPSATFVSSMTSAEFDVLAPAGSSVANKANLDLGRPSGDVVGGSANDAVIWMWGWDTTHGANVGIQFGRTDIVGNGSVQTGGTLIAEVGPYTYGGGIDFSQATFNSFFLKSTGTIIGTVGDAAFRSVFSNNPAGGIGYATGAGGTVAQATSKSTGVTLNTVTGAITLNNAALAAGTIVSFTLTDTSINATDTLVLNHISGGTIGSYSLNAAAAAGSATITVRNNTAGSLSEAMVIEFAVVKGVTS